MIYLCLYQTFPGYVMIFLRTQLTAYFNDVVEENVNPADHKANDHY